jgi:xanthine dehydrogenase accessory factor
VVPTPATKDLQTIVERLCRGGPGGVLATLVAVEGSSYRRPGARMWIEPGRRLGSLSGGCLEEDVILRARAVAASGRVELAIYDTQADDDVLWGVGLGCHGIVRILLEPVAPRPDWAVALADALRTGRRTELDVGWRGPAERLGTRLGTGGGDAPADGIFRESILPPTSLAIFGAGDDAQPLARFAAELGWRVTVADPRPAFPTEARFPNAAALVLGPAEELVARALPPAGSLAVVMTHHYLHDRPLLRHLLPLPLAYLGLLGPRARAERILADLSAEGLCLAADMKGRLHAPVGLDLGAEAPEGVALSIIAEMSAALAGRDGQPLRDRTKPIHA